MARKCMMARMKKRQYNADKYREKRLELKKIINSPDSSGEEKAEAQYLLQSLPRDASPTRIKNRCLVTGRARAYMRPFKLCRHEFRRLAHKGQLPGVTKSSW